MNQEKYYANYEEYGTTMWLLRSEEKGRFLSSYTKPDAPNLTKENIERMKNGTPNIAAIVGHRVNYWMADENGDKISDVASIVQQNAVPKPSKSIKVAFEERSDAIADILRKYFDDGELNPASPYAQKLRAALTEAYNVGWEQCAKDL